jgi:chondroitin-sulfate-ABC endolyase/exolyase
MAKKQTARFMALGALLTLASGCQSLSGPTLGEVQVPAFPLPDYRGVPTFSFEDGSTEGINPDPGGSIQTDSRHFRDGNHALHWQWAAGGSTLVFRTPVPYQKPLRDYAKSGRDVSVFGAWIYRETPLPKTSIRISFGHQGKENCHFNYGLDFTGWRFICVEFADMAGTPDPEMDYIAMQAPADLAQGELWLDIVQPVFRDDSRWQWPDYQTPFIKSGLANSLYLDSPAARKLAGRPLPATSKAHIDRVKQALVGRYTSKAFSAESYQAVKTYYDSLHISKTPARIQGKAIGTNQIKDLLKHLLKVAALHPVAPRRERRELERMYVLMTEHLLDQGWAEGSALNAQHHFGYKSRAWAPSVLLMEDVLARHDLLRPMVRSMIWFGRDFLDYTLPFADYSEATTRSLSGRLADYLNTFSNSHLITLLLLEDTAFKEATLQSYQQMLSAMITSSNGALKPDGSFFHHGMHYAGYAVPAMAAFANIVEFIDGTPYEVTPAAYQRLKTCFLMAEKWGYPYWAFNACGRHPITGSIRRLRSTFEKLAVAVPGTAAVDPELAIVCRTVFGEPTQPALQKYNAPARPSQGFWSMNYSGTGVCKWLDRTAILKGYGQGVRSHETYGRDNRYGRYGSHGTMLIFGQGAPDTSGFLPDGWDWAQPPGATTLQLPHDMLEGDPKRFYGWNPPQEAPFTGSGHLGNRYGAFAFALNGQKHEQSLQVRKSVFALDNLLVCLGSDIANTSGKHHTVTTLFQCGGERLDVTFPDSSNVATQKDYQLRRQSKATDWLIDPQGNGFLIAEGNADLIVQRSLQHSKHNKTRKPNQGRFVKAWLDHGTRPKSAAYEYVACLSASAKQMTELARKKPYEIVARTRACHAIRMPAPGLSFYVFFEAGAADDILAVDTPMIVITKRQADGALLLSVTNPNPSLRRAFNAPEPIHRVSLTLQGSYRATPTEAVRSAKVTDGNTVLELTLKGSHSAQIHCRP